MIIAITSFPTLMLADPFYESAQSFVASLLSVPINDRFAMEFDATVGWVLGCIQYGLLAGLIRGWWRGA
jgi:hypothetical protein